MINSSPGDLAPVFDAILEKTLALCAASFGDLSTYAGEQFLAVATRGFPPSLIDFYRNPFTPGPKSFFVQLVNGEDVLHIADMAAEFSSAPAGPLSHAGVAGRRDGGLHAPDDRSRTRRGADTRSADGHPQSRRLACLARPDSP